MKTKLLISAALFIAAMTQASIWRVSVDATYLPHFSTVQKAVDGAQAGDTIYVYPGSYNEGISITKLLTIVGPGYFLTENKKDSLTRFTSSININSITFNKGSDYSTIIGIVSQWGWYEGGILLESTSHINIVGCYVNRVNISNCNVVNVERNYISGNYYGGLTGGNSKNTIVTNNIIGSYISFDSNSDVNFKNNYAGSDISLSNSTLENNILLGSSFSLSTCWEQNNIFKTGCNYSTLSSNSFYAVSADVYPVIPVADNYQLSINSVAKGKGVGGSDLGPFGGNKPYCLSGISSIPSIVSFFAEPQVSNEGGLKIRLKVKGNKP